MKLEMITEGLKTLLLENNYNPVIIHFYQREWNKIQSFLMDEYGDTEFDMESGLKYLEKQYGFISRCNDRTLSQQRVQLLRVIHMLEDYSLHKVLTRRYFASKNPLVLNSYYSAIFAGYTTYLEATELSATTKEHYKKSAMVFMDYISQTKVLQTGEITMENCNAYLKTLT
jgi:integrase/recombinase XerD